ncbi:ABC transporter ATP-binding protein [Ruania albidiflava]|uniref:ABC transporter ATP-binding protein n=1 Tax=Ruania albidiflava TaxID=366586 RepID=UPI0003B65FB1|nr:ATP-binding cassette domain-containing protein [Ruania albidiflava]
MAEPLLRVRDLVTTYPIRSALLRRKIGEVRAVDGVSFDIARGQTVGLVGESGSGKSTLARTVIGLEQAEAGSIEFQGTELVGLSARQMRPVRRDIQMVFQDPYTALNPRLTVRQILSEAWRIHPDLLPAQDWDEEVRRLLDVVGLDPQYADRYPHQFSGGQRQRVGIARALAVRPKLIVCDEAVSALDVSVQAQVLNLLDDLQAELGLTYLFIAHDLSVVRHISDEVIVMNRGQVVEHAPTDQLFADPQHEYTQTLLAAVPVVRPWNQESAA